MYGLLIFNNAEDHASIELPYQNWNSITGGFTQSSYDMGESVGIYWNTENTIFLDLARLDPSVMVFVSISGTNYED